MKNTIKILTIAIVAILVNFDLLNAQIEIKSLDINSSSDDFAPALVNNNRKMYITSDKKGKQQVYEVRRESNGELSIYGLCKGDLNNATQTGSVTLTPDGNYMIFAAYEHDAKGEGRTDLYSARKEKGKWVDVVNLGPLVNSEYWDSQPSLSADGQTLYFASDRPGGNGGSDIYMATKTREGWTRAKNAGSTINTNADEMAPIIGQDNKTFTFASNRSNSLGGFDIYFSKVNNGNFSSPKNAGEPINSAADELFYVPIQNTNVAYFSSNRGGGEGGLDIYHAIPNPHESDPVIFVTGKVLDSESKDPINAQVTITDLKTNKKIATFNSDDENGDYYVALQPGRTYSVTASSPDHFFYSERFEIPTNAKGTELKKDIILSRNSTRLLVAFDFNKSTLNDESIPDLENLLAYLQSNPNINTVLEGHTDDVGSDDFNNKLSKDRADAVKAWLVNNGVATKRIETKGYGKTKPLVKGTSDEARATNRRVEIKIK